jgi:phosphopantetheine adenylyltransferase
MKSFKEFVNKKYVVVYPGRFQPFHLGHYDKYEFLVKEFGKDSVYIATSNTIEPDKSPLNFKEKHLVISSLFDIPKNKIIQVRNPYNPVEVLSKQDDTTVYITAVGKKDSDRLGGKYYRKFESMQKSTETYKDAGYVLILPEDSTKYKGEAISGTLVRSVFRESTEKEKKDLFKQMYGKFDQKIYSLINQKLNEKI